MSDPHENGGLSVTFKQDGKDGMWLVFHGSPAKQREQILAAFGFDPADFKDDSLVSIANEANKAYKAITTVGRTLGGRVMSSTSTNSDAWTAAAQQQGGASAEPQRDPLFDTIESISDIPTLKKLWAENRAKLDKALDTHDPELVAAWNARGKTIQGGTA